MKTLISRTALLMLASTQIAAAHPGHHDAMAPSSLVDHFLASPFHAVPLVLAVLVLGVAIHGMRKAKRWPRGTHPNSDGARSSQKSSETPEDET
ncbi:MAG: hypothetical protein ACE37E_16180 [Hyphomicrobiales bacterium]